MSFCFVLFFLKGGYHGVREETGCRSFPKIVLVKKEKGLHKRVSVQSLHLEPGVVAFFPPQCCTETSHRRSLWVALQQKHSPVLDRAPSSLGHPVENPFRKGCSRAFSLSSFLAAVTLCLSLLSVSAFSLVDCLYLLHFSHILRFSITSSIFFPSVCSQVCVYLECNKGVGFLLKASRQLKDRGCAYLKLRYIVFTHPSRSWNSCVLITSMATGV